AAGLLGRGRPVGSALSTDPVPARFDMPASQENPVTKPVLSVRSGPTLALRMVLLIAMVFTISACDSLGGKKTPPPVATQPPPKVEVTPPPSTQPPGYTRDPSRFYSPAYMAGERPVRVALLLPFNSPRDNVRTLSN